MRLMRAAVAWRRIPERVARARRGRARRRQRPLAHRGADGSAGASPTRWPDTRAALVLPPDTPARRDARRPVTSTGARARAQARSAIEPILARSEFQQSAASRWREQLQERVGKWFEDLWARFGGGRGTARGTALVFAWAAALAALIGLGFWLARTIADRPRGAALEPWRRRRRASTRARACASRARGSTPRADARRRPVRVRRGARPPRRARRLARRRRANAARVPADAAGDRQPALRDARPDPPLRADLVRQPCGRRR